VVRDLARVYGSQATDRELSEHWSGPPAMVDRLAGELDVGPSDLVLDAGCGVGGPARRLRGLVGCRVVGIDLLVPVVREARRRSEEDGSAVGFAAGSVTSLPLGDGSVDQVWSLGVVAHLDVRAFAAEAARVLHPGGLLAVTEAFWDGRRTPRFEGSAPGPWNPLTVEALDAELRDAGLNVDVRAWPGEGIPGALEAGDADLRADLADGRLAPALVVGGKAGS
jgi:SAM-dependent methyltransferase